MREEVLEAPLGKRFAKIEIIDDNVGVCDDPGHCGVFYDKLII